MKKILISMLAVAALVSCSKEESIRVDQGEAIAFGNAFVDNSTRATDPSYSANDIESFNVYGTVNGLNIFNGNAVTKNGAAYGAAWTLTGNKQYWIAGADYEFVAVVDGNKAGVTETHTDANSGMPTSINYTADGATDLLCASVVRPDNTDTSIVAFTFQHLLSKVNFTVNNGSKDASGYSFVVKNIAFNGATAATYNVESAAWGAATATGATALDPITVASGAENAELATEVLFLPGTYTISFTVDILYNGTVVTSTNYPATGTTYSHTLAANNAYNFNVGVAVGELIQFTVEEQPTWADETDVTVQ